MVLKKKNGLPHPFGKPSKQRKVVQQVSPEQHATTTARRLCERLESDRSMQELKLGSINDGDHTVDLSSLNTPSIKMLATALKQNITLQTVSFECPPNKSGSKVCFSTIVFALSAIPTLKNAVVTNTWVLQEDSFQKLISRGISLRSLQISKIHHAGNATSTSTRPSTAKVPLDRAEESSVVKAGFDTSNLIGTVTPCLRYISSLRLHKCGLDNLDVVLLSRAIRLQNIRLSMSCPWRAIQKSQVKV
jgi:hypothetical protein